MEFGETLKELRIKKGLTQKDVAQAIGVTEQTVFRYETGRRYPAFRVLTKLEELFGVRFEYSPEYDSQVSTALNKKDVVSLALPDDKRASAYYDLIARKDSLKHWIDSLDYEAFGKTEQLLTLAGMYTTKPQEAGKEKTASLDNSRRSDFKLKIPVMGRSAAGLPMEMIEVPEAPVAINGETYIQAGDFAVIAVGDSMVEAGIHDGDKCVIRPQEWVENGQIALVAVEDGSTIKKFFKDDDGFRLVPCNHAHPIQHYSCDAPIRVLGRFISVVD